MLQYRKNYCGLYRESCGNHKDTGFFWMIGTDHRNTMQTSYHLGIAPDKEFFQGGFGTPVLFSEVYDGEIYDAGMETDNWCAEETELEWREKWRK